MADIAKITLKGESEAKNFIDEALRGDIAYEELSTTVSKTGGYVAGDHLIYQGQYYEVVADIAQGGTIVTSGAGQNVEEREVGDEIKKNKTQVVAQIQTLENDISDIETSIANKVLYYTSQACSALTGNFCTISNAKITANHVVAEAVFADPSAITTGVTWTTANGSLVLNGTCFRATTVNIVLVKKNN